MSNSLLTIATVLAGMFGLSLVLLPFKCWSKYRTSHTKTNLLCAVGATALWIAVVISEIFVVNNQLTKSDEPRVTTPTENTAHTSTPVAVQTLEETFPTGEYVAGGWYFGAKDGNQLDGEGRMQFDNGDIYEGHWIKGKKDGLGTFFYARSGDLYCGDWENDSRTGEGLYVWNASEKLCKELLSNPRDEISDAYLEELCNTTESSFYYGSYQEGKMENGAYYRWKGSIVRIDQYGNTQVVEQKLSHYEGSFHDDLFEGYGTFTYDNGDVFEGIFIAGNIWKGTFVVNKKEKKYDVREGKAH